MMPGHIPIGPSSSLLLFTPWYSTPSLRTFLSQKTPPQSSSLPDFHNSHLLKLQQRKANGLIGGGGGGDIDILEIVVAIGKCAIG